MKNQFNSAISNLANNESFLKRDVRRNSSSLKQLIFLCLFFISLGTRALADIDDGLVLHYTFDTNEGEVVTDHSGHGNDGIATGPEWTANGVNGGGFEFFGDGSINLGDLGAVENQSALTFGAWINPSSPQLAGIMGKTLSGNVVFLLNLGTPNNMEVAVKIPGVPNYTAGIDGLLTYSDWQHVMATFDGTQIKLYFNGQLVRESEVFESGFTNDNNVGASIGDSATGRGWHFRGMMDDVRIYDRVLTENEVRALYEQQIDQPKVTEIGFSNTLDGIRNVTKFTHDNTIHFFVKHAVLDARLQATAEVKVVLRNRQGNSRARETVFLEAQPDGSFTGSLDLSELHTGSTTVTIRGFLQSEEDRVFPIFSHFSRISIVPTP